MVFAQAKLTKNCIWLPWYRITNRVSRFQLQLLSPVLTNPTKRRLASQTVYARFSMPNTHCPINLLTKWTQSYSLNFLSGIFTHFVDCRHQWDVATFVLTSDLGNRNGDSIDISLSVCRNRSFRDASVLAILRIIECDRLWCSVAIQQSELPAPCKIQNESFGCTIFQLIDPDSLFVG